MKNTLLVGSGLVASVAVFSITSGLISAKDAAVASLFAVPSALAAHIISDSKAQKTIRESQSKLSKLQRELDTANSRAINFDICESMRGQLQTELDKTRHALEIATQEHQKAYDLTLRLQQNIAALEGQTSASEEEIATLRAEIEEWVEQFSSRVNAESDRLFQIAKKAEIERIFAEHDFITSEAMSIADAFQKWGLKVSQRFQDKNAAIADTQNTYRQHIQEFTALVTKERDEYLKQIDLLNERVAQLQRQLNGDLIEPVYGHFSYQWNARLADDIARRIWDTLHIPLAVKGYKSNSDGSAEAGYAYSRSQSIESLVDDLSRVSKDLAKSLGIHKIIGIRKHELSDLLIISWRIEAPIKKDEIKLLAGSEDDFLAYVTSNPIRYRLIADPGQGKTPITAVMLSAILKSGCKRGNVPKGKIVSNTLVTVAYPGVQSSLKDSSYPLEMFLEYGTESSAVASFNDAIKDWEYRKQNIKYAEEFFQIRIWDEFDNTLNSASDPQAIAKNLKKLLKEGGHNNVGWIVSGQSVMTSQIPGFKDDNRSLFTEIIIGIPKIRMYVKKYARGKNSDANLAKLERNLDDLETYIESKNQLVTDDARLLRIALVVDDKSPKLYFLPNLDNVTFDANTISESHNKALAKLSTKPATTDKHASPQAELNPDGVRFLIKPPFLPKPTMQGSASCPHCGSSELTFHSGERCYCKSCKRRFAVSKVVFK